MTHIDGLSCEYSDWRFNLRISNTAEPFLRLNIEGKSPEIIEKKKKELVDYIDQNK
jgi:phosphomannomutase